MGLTAVSGMPSAFAVSFPFPPSTPKVTAYFAEHVVYVSALKGRKGIVDLSVAPLLDREAGTVEHGLRHRPTLEAEALRGQVVNLGDAGIALVEESRRRLCVCASQRVDTLGARPLIHDNVTDSAERACRTRDVHKLDLEPHLARERGGEVNVQATGIPIQLVAERRHSGAEINAHGERTCVNEGTVLHRLLNLSPR